MFCFQFEGIRLVKGTRGWIILEDDNPIFKRPYKFNEVEKTFVQAWKLELLDIGLVELSKGEYALVTMMSTKDIFGNWTKGCMCGDFHLVYKRTRLDKYAMPFPKEIFDDLGQTNVFNTLDWRFGYH